MADGIMVRSIGAGKMPIEWEFCATGPQSPIEGVSQLFKTRFAAQAVLRCQNRPAVGLRVRDALVYLRPEPLARDNVGSIEGDIQSNPFELPDHMVDVLVLIVFPSIRKPELRHQYIFSQSFSTVA